MKKLSIILLLFLGLAVGRASAQTGGFSFPVSEIEMNHTGETVGIRLTIPSDRRTVKKDQTLIITPVLQNGAYRLELPLLAIRGRKARISAERHRLASGREFFSHDIQTVGTAGDVLRYAVSIPFQPEMVGSNLIFEGVAIGCCSAVETEAGLVAANLLVHPEAQPVQQQLPQPTPSTADQLAVQYPFIVPASRLNETTRTTSGGTFNYLMPLELGRGASLAQQNDVDHFIEENREGSLTINFRQGSSVIDRNLSNNNNALVQLISSARTIQTSADSRVSRVIVAGFASPEGSIALNERLAWDRALAVKEFLLRNSTIPVEVVHLFNGSVDWKGLRELVAASDMREKHRVLDIIDWTPEIGTGSQPGRLAQLQQLNGGSPYRFMYQHYFPLLRNAAYIKIYYDNQ